MGMSIRARPNWSAAQHSVLLTHRSPLIYTLWLMHRSRALCSGCFYAVARFAERRSAFFRPAAAAEMRYPTNGFVQPADGHTCVLLLFYFLIKRATPFAEIPSWRILPKSSCKIVMCASVIKTRNSRARTLGFAKLFHRWLMLPRRVSSRSCLRWLASAEISVQFASQLPQSALMEYFTIQARRQPAFFTALLFACIQMEHLLYSSWGKEMFS